MTIARHLGRIELKSKSTIMQFRFNRTKKSFLRVRKKGVSNFSSLSLVGQMVNVE